MPTDMVDDDSLDLGFAIRQRREELGLRAEDVASRAGYSLATIRRVENGEGVRVRTLRAIARALETTVGALVDNGGEAA